MHTCSQKVTSVKNCKSLRCRHCDSSSCSPHECRTD